jgi:MASE1
VGSDRRGIKADAVGVSFVMVQTFSPVERTATSANAFRSVLAADLVASQSATPIAELLTDVAIRGIFRPSIDRFRVIRVAGKIAARSAGLRILGANMLQNLAKEVHLRTRADLMLSWIGAVGLAVAVGIAYFLAARLSLALLAKPDGVAVFWPAAGVSCGILIALGREARLPVAGGAMIATIIAGLMGDRNVWTGTILAFCNAGEALFASWLIERYFGSGFHPRQAAQRVGAAGGCSRGNFCVGDRRDGGF